MRDCVVRTNEVCKGYELSGVTEHMYPRYSMIAKSSESKVSKSIRADSGYEGSACSTI